VRRGVLATVAIALLCCAGPAAASPPAPTGLSVAGGATWRANSAFYLSWSGPSSDSFHYRVRDQFGAVIGEGMTPYTGATVHLIPGHTGIHTAQVWLVDGEGNSGPAASVALYFDDARPGTSAPWPLPEWLGRAAFPLHVRLTHPEGTQPLSGIVGYAVSLGGSADEEPCLAADRCSPAELTLVGGIENDELEIPALPEGVNHLRTVAVSGTGMKSAQSGHAVLWVDMADPVTRLTGAPGGWTSRAVRLTATATDSDSGMSPRSGGPPPFTAIRVDDGVPAVALGASVGTEVIGEGVHQVAYYARDAAGNVDDGALSNSVRNRAPRTALVRIDRTPPGAGFANSQDPRDPDLVRVQIDDALSGADPGRGWIGVRLAGSGDRFEQLPAAPPGPDELRARWSSDAYPQGLYEFRALAYDAAGNTTVVERRRNGSPMTLSNPLKATSALRAGFRHGRLSRAAPLGSRVRIAGRLTTGRNTSLGGMPLRIVERFAPGARPAVRVSRARTGADGRFSYRLAPGPSRAVAVNFAGHATLARASAPALELRVRSRVRLRVSRRVARVGGRPVVFRGRVFAGSRRSVQLQFRVPGLPWTEFRTVRANRGGYFRYRYRFSDDDSRGARFQFRAYVPAQENWPYEPGGSRPVLVRGK